MNRDPDRSDLAKRIIDLDVIPAVTPENEQEPLVIQIVDDDRLASQDGERVITLRPDCLMLNGLLLFRNTWATGSDIRSRVGLHIKHTGFMNRVSHLHEGLRYLIGISGNLIETNGYTNWRKAYKLSERLIFSDERSNPERTAQQYGITSPIVPFEEYDGTQRLQFAATEDRRKLLGALFREYANLPEVRHAEEVVWGVAAGHKQAQQLEKSAPQMSPPEVYAQFLEIDKGAVAFAQPAQNELTRIAGTASVIAYHKLLASVLPLVKRVTFSYGKTYLGRLDDEFFQLGCEAAVKVIMDLGGDKNLLESCEYFYIRCAKKVDYAMLQAMRDDHLHMKHVTETDYHLSRKIRKAQESLRHSLSREPSTQEIARHIEEPTLDVQERMAAMAAPDVSISSFDGADSIVLDQEYPDDNIDRQLELFYYQDLVDYLFASSFLTDRQKIVLSLGYGVYTSRLRGATLRNRKSYNVFIYPYTQEGFNEMVQRINTGSPTHIGRVVGLDPNGVQKLLDNGKAGARSLLKDFMD